MEYNDFDLDWIIFPVVIVTTFIGITPLHQFGKRLFAIYTCYSFFMAVSILSGTIYNLTSKQMLLYFWCCVISKIK